MRTTTVDTGGGFVRATGTEADICRMIADRQAKGLIKYRTTVRDNPLALRQWLMHSIEEKLDDIVYMMRIVEELDKEADDGR